MWKSGGVKPESVSPNLAAPRSAFGRLYRLLLMVAVLFATVVFIFPIVFEPRVEPPTQLQLGSPFSMAVRISNQNPFMPLTDVEYSCEVSKLTLASGAEVTDAKALIRGTLRKFEGRKAIAASCETAYIANAPIKAAEYKLTLTYRMYPWPQHRTSVYHIAAQMDGNGRVTGWSLD
jgi:hypothetical protein